MLEPKSFRQGVDTVGAPTDAGNDSRQFLGVGKMQGTHQWTATRTFGTSLCLERSTKQDARLRRFFTHLGHHGEASEGCTRIRTCFPQGWLPQKLSGELGHQTLDINVGKMTPWSCRDACSQTQDACFLDCFLRSPSSQRSHMDIICSLDIP